MPKLSHIFPLFAVFVLAVAAFAGCGSDSSPAMSSGPTAAPASTMETTAAPASADAVSIQDFDFSPNPVEVAKGTKITFTNDGDAPHTATADDQSFDTGTLNHGESKEVAFDTPGEIPYTCTIHPFMHGTLVVK